MAAKLASTIQAEILETSEAEKAFEPWWDKTKKYLIYGLVIGGLVILPSGLMSSSLMCTKCTKQIPACQNLTDEEFTDEKLTTHWKFDSAYGTYHSVDPWLYYLPLILLAMALILLAIDKVFEVVFKSVQEIQSFYQLVQKELGQKNETDSDANEVLKMQVEMEQTFGHGSTWNIYGNYVAK